MVRIVQRIQGMTTRAIGYVRCSTDEQTITVEAQTAKLNAWAALNDAEITIEIDAGISGKSMHNRPALKRALDAIRAKRATVIVVCDLSRLSRCTRDALTIADELAKRGAELVALREQIPAGPAGKLILTVLAALAELERAQVGIRTSAALQHLKSQGRRVGGIPYGFAVAADGESLVEHTNEQATIAAARDLRARGLALRAVAETLASRGMLARSGRPFAPSAIAAMVG